mgnify:CR=1 FL=1
MDFEDLPWYGQFLLTLVLMLVVLGIFYFTYYKSKNNTIKAMESEVQQISMKIIQAKRKINQLKDIEKGIEEKKAQLRELRKILPEQKEIAEITQKVKSIISNTGLSLNNLKEQTERSLRKVLMQYPLNLSVKGNYHNLAVFFDQLSELEKIFTVDNLTITPIKGELSSKAYSVIANFVASTYYLVAEEESLQTGN